MLTTVFVNIQSICTSILNQLKYNSKRCEQIIFMAINSSASIFFFSPIIVRIPTSPYAPYQVFRNCVCLRYAIFSHSFGAKATPNSSGTPESQFAQVTLYDSEGQRVDGLPQNHVKWKLHLIVIERLRIVHRTTCFESKPPKRVLVV